MSPFKSHSSNQFSGLYDVRPAVTRTPAIAEGHARLPWSTPAWMAQALCSQTDPESFFPEKGGSTREAKRICLSCEVRAERLEYALANAERFGIWGGLSERERRKLNGGPWPTRRRPRREGPCIGCGRPLRPCNTPADQAPGTVAHAAKGYCSGCYTRAHKKTA